MSSNAVLIVAVLAASIVLVLQLKAQLFPLLALVVSGVQALLAFGVLRLGIPGVNLGLLLGGALLVAGIAIWMKTGGKTAITAATTVALMGALQVLRVLL